jgi:hypothetical protein
VLLYQGRDGSTGGVLCFNADRATKPAAAVMMMIKKEQKEKKKMKKMKMTMIIITIMKIVIKQQ